MRFSGIFARRSPIDGRRLVQYIDEDSKLEVLVAEFLHSSPRPFLKNDSPVVLFANLRFESFPSGSWRKLLGIFVALF